MSEQNILSSRREHQPQQKCDSKSQSLFIIALAVITVVSAILFSIVWPLIIPDCVWCQWPYINDNFDDDGIYLLFFSSSLRCRCIRFLLTIWGVLSHSRHSKETKMIQQTLRLWPFWMFKMRSFVINALNLDESNESKSYEKGIIWDCMYNEVNTFFLSK